jgi:hypothetical protein
MCFVNERTFAILCPEHYMEHLTFEAFKTSAARPYTGCVDLWDRLQDIRTQRVKTVAQQLSRRQQQRRLRALAKSQAISQTRAASLLKSAAAALNGTDNKMAEELQLSTSWPQSLGAPSHLLPASFLFSYSFPTNSNDPDVVRQEAIALNIKVEKEEMKAGALAAGGSSGSAPSGSVAPLESLLNQDALTDLGTDWKVHDSALDPRFAILFGNSSFSRVFSRLADLINTSVPCAKLFSSRCCIRTFTLLSAFELLEVLFYTGRPALGKHYWPKLLQPRAPS